MQVGNYTADNAVWTRPEDITMARPTYYISTANGTSDLGGQIVGALVSTALVFQQLDPPYYNKLMTEAVNLYGAVTHDKLQGRQDFLCNLLLIDKQDIVFGQIRSKYNDQSYKYNRYAIQLLVKELES